MFDFSHLLFDNLIVHQVGNKAMEEGFKFSENTHDLNDDQLQVVLYDFFFSHFNNLDQYKFTADAAMKLFVDSFFTESIDFQAFSEGVAMSLYESMTHPKIKGGELFVCSFRDVLINDELVDAVGIFKTDKKDTFLQLNETKTDNLISYFEGIDISKLNKGVLIFNTLEDEGYLVKVIDTLAKANEEAKFWKDNFLSLEPLKDSVYNTKTYLQLAKEFVEETMANNKYKSLDVIDKAVEYFEQEEEFRLDKFANAVFNSPDVEAQFAAKVGDCTGFEIDQRAVKSEKKKIRNVINLDDSIKIQLNPNHSDRNKHVISRGQEGGKYFYKIFFEHES